MAAKLYANTADKVLVMTLAPDVNDQVYLNVQKDVWSALQHDWQDDVTLRGHTFPLEAIGGQTISAGKLGTTYVLADPWHFHPYEADHDFTIDGNLFTELATTKLVQQSTGMFTITVSRNLSTLVEVVEAIEAAPIDIKLDKIIDGVYGQKLVIWSEDPLAPASEPGFLVMWEEDGLTLIGHKEIWEDREQTVGYRGKGIGWEGIIQPGLPATF